MFVQFKDVYRQGELYQSLGNVLVNQKDYGAAREYYLKALDVFVQFNNLHSQGELYTNLGTIYWGQKDYVAAREYYLKALDVYVQFKDVYSQGRVYQNLGIISSDQKDYAAAREYYQNALSTFLQFPEEVSSIGRLVHNIVSFVKGTSDKVFGQAMIQKTLPYFSGENKDYLMELLHEINQL